MHNGAKCKMELIADRSQVQRGVELRGSSRKASLLIIIFAIPSPFLLPSFLGGRREGEENNQSRGQNSCLSSRSAKS